MSRKRSSPRSRPSNLELYYENRHYGSDEEYLAAAGRRDARGIQGDRRRPGFLLQIDDPRMATHYKSQARRLDRGLQKRSSRCGVEAVNHALRGIPEDRVRFHTCYSVNVAPRVHDFELKAFRRPDAAGPRRRLTSSRQRNPRHEHEWQVWEGRQAPPTAKILVPGVGCRTASIWSSIRSWVAQRIMRFAGVVGARRRVMAGTGLRFSARQEPATRVHPDVAWAKTAIHGRGRRDREAASCGRG